MLDRARQVRSDHPWPPGSHANGNATAEPFVREILFRLSYALALSLEQHDVYHNVGATRGPVGKGAIVRDCVALVLTGRYPDCLDEID